MKKTHFLTRPPCCPELVRIPPKPTSEVSYSKRKCSISSNVFRLKPLELFSLDILSYHSSASVMWPCAQPIALMPALTTSGVILLLLFLTYRSSLIKTYNFVYRYSIIRSNLSILYVFKEKLFAF